MTYRSARTRRDSERAFTLLELIAVVAIFGLVITLFGQNFGLTTTSTLRGDARQLATHLEYARARAVMTGKPHRVLLGLEEGWYQIEWFVADRDVDEELAASDEVDPRGPIPMAPPLHDIPSYRPIPGQAGDVSWLDEALFFEGVQMDEGWFDTGEFQLVFSSDGATAAAQVVIAAPDVQGMVVDVSPLEDAVRIYDDEG